MIVVWYGMGMGMGMECRSNSGYLDSLTGKVGYYHNCYLYIYIYIYISIHDFTV